MHNGLYNLIEVIGMAIIWTVEDEETISILLVKIIKSMGHEGVHCYDAAEVAQQMKKGLPD